jgi:HEPN domain-containing protein
MRPPLHDHVCFWCREAAQNYLKALFQESGQVAPRTQDLERLLILLLPHHATLRPLRRGLKFLTAFGEDTLYPGYRTTKRQSMAAVRWARRVRETVRSLLGIDSRRRPCGRAS